MPSTEWALVNICSHPRPLFGEQVSPKYKQGCPASQWLTFSCLSPEWLSEDKSAGYVCFNGARSQNLQSVSMYGNFLFISSVHHFDVKICVSRCSGPCVADSYWGGWGIKLRKHRDLQRFPKCSISQAGYWVPRCPFYYNSLNCTYVSIDNFVCIIYFAI